MRGINFLAVIQHVFFLIFKSLKYAKSNIYREIIFLRVSLEMLALTYANWNLNSTRVSSLEIKLRQFIIIIVIALKASITNPLELWEWVRTKKLFQYLIYGIISKEWAVTATPIDFQTSHTKKTVDWSANELKIKEEIFAFIKSRVLLLYLFQTNNLHEVQNNIKL